MRGNMSSMTKNAKSNRLFFQTGVLGGLRCEGEREVWRGGRSQGAGRSTAPNGHEACSKGSPSLHRNGGQQAIEPPTADRAILHGRLPPTQRVCRVCRVLRADDPGLGSRGKKVRGVNAGRGRSPRRHDCTAKQLRRAPTNIDATVDSRISRGSPEKKKRF